ATFEEEGDDETDVQQLVDAIPALTGLTDTARRSAIATVSDVLLASYHATEHVPSDLNGLAALYRVYHAPAADEATRKSSLRTYMRRPLVAPAVKPLPKSRQGHATAAGKTETAGRAALGNAIAELVRLHQPELLVAPAKPGGR